MLADVLNCPDRPGQTGPDPDSPDRTESAARWIHPTPTAQATPAHADRPPYPALDAPTRGSTPDPARLARPTAIRAEPRERHTTPRPNDLGLAHERRPVLVATTPTNAGLAPWAQNDQAGSSTPPRMKCDSGSTIRHHRGRFTRKNPPRREKPTETDREPAPRP